MKGFGDFIKEHRVRSGFTSMRKLSEASGISTATLSRIESEIQLPQYKTLTQLAKYLTSTTLGELLERTGYFGDMDNESIDSVKTFFNDHYALDNQLLSMISYAYNSENTKKQVFRHITEKFHDVVSEYGDICFDFESIISFINYMDLNLDDKQLLIKQIFTIVEKNRDGSISEIDLSDIDLKKYKITVDGHTLTDKDILKLVGLIRLERKISGEEKE